jgi:hypothetical protein
MLSSFFTIICTTKKTDFKEHNGVTTKWLINLSEEAFERWKGYVNTTMLSTDENEGDRFYLDFKDQNGDLYSTQIYSDEYVIVNSVFWFNGEENKEYLCTITFSDLVHPLMQIQ